ncbi:MAG TPA: His/Gly/Thr/Pro-type tRNA ligase C-terminal domain-containing protein [Chthoniobacterales bacterium]|nr:His/Gly/Thr/Pro-type tRNA ligase C-terminal domain-containing protein [Chthoniobacterales bacterium]
MRWKRSSQHSRAICDGFHSIANAEQMKVHTMLVIGNRDMEDNAVSVRVHGQGNLGAKPRNEVIAGILESIRNRHQ